MINSSVPKKLLELWEPEHQNTVLDASKDFSLEEIAAKGVEFFWNHIQMFQGCEPLLQLLATAVRDTA